MGSPGVIDTSLILTLAAIGKLDPFLSMSRYEWRVTPLVRGELVRRETRDPVENAIAAGTLTVTQIGMTVAREVDLWGFWSALVDAGEAEAIAIAVARHWVVGLEDRQAQRALDREAGPGRWINAVNLLLDAIADGVLSFAEADALFQALDSYPGYKKRGIVTLAAFGRMTQARGLS